MVQAFLDGGGGAGPLCPILTSHWSRRGRTMGKGAPFSTFWRGVQLWDLTANKPTQSAGGMNNSCRKRTWVDLLLCFDTFISYGKFTTWKNNCPKFILASFLKNANRINYSSAAALSGLGAITYFIISSISSLKSTSFLGYGCWIFSICILYPKLGRRVSKETQCPHCVVEAIPPYNDKGWLPLSDGNPPPYL
jgi:hypothetical protein